MARWFYLYKNSCVIHMNIINDYFNFIKNNLMDLLRYIWCHAIAHTNYKSEIDHINWYVNLSTSLVAFCLFYILFILIVNIISLFIFKNNYYLKKKYMYFNIISTLIIIALMFLKLHLSLKFEKAVNLNLCDIRFDFYMDNKDINFML